MNLFIVASCAYAANGSSVAGNNPLKIARILDVLLTKYFQLESFSANHFLHIYTHSR